MEPFEFHADLFDLRSAVIELLSDNGFVWLSDFGAVDLQHDVYGLEVTGIRNEEDAIAIERLLRRKFPQWGYHHTFYEDLNLAEIGWKVMISRERDPDDGKVDLQLSPLGNLILMFFRKWRKDKPPGDG